MPAATVRLEEVDRAWAAEPVARLRRYLESQNLWTEKQENAWSEQCKSEVDAAVTRYLALEPEPLRRCLITSTRSCRQPTRASAMSWPHVTVVRRMKEVYHDKSQYTGRRQTEYG